MSPRSEPLVDSPALRQRPGKGAVHQPAEKSVNGTGSKDAAVEPKACLQKPARGVPRTLLLLGCGIAIGLAISLTSSNLWTRLRSEDSESEDADDAEWPRYTDPYDRHHGEYDVSLLGGCEWAS